MATMEIDLYTDPASEKAMQDNIKRKPIYMKEGTADNLADLSAKCSTPEFIRPVDLDMMGRASRRALPEQQVTDAVRAVDNLADDSRDHVIVRDVMEVIMKMVKRSLGCRKKHRGAEAHPKQSRNHNSFLKDEKNGITTAHETVKCQSCASEPRLVSSDTSTYQWANSSIGHVCTNC
eukprot:13934876-Heterocapsa_arctica.AAC.1